MVLLHQEAKVSRKSCVRSVSGKRAVSKLCRMITHPYSVSELCRRTRADSPPVGKIKRLSGQMRGFQAMLARSQVGSVDCVGGGTSLASLSACVRNLN